MRKSGELLKRCDLHQDLPVRILVVCATENRPQQLFGKLLRLFFLRCGQSGSIRCFYRVGIFFRRKTK